MGQWTQHYKIVKPTAAKNGYIAQDSYGADHASISNFSWYTQVMKGAGTRLTKYTHYEAMDTDVDVSRAIDTVAEEMSSKNDKTELPFNIHYQNDDNKEVKESVVMTVKAALRHWADLQDLENRIYRTARFSIKFGDCFFRKFSDHKKWMFVEPKDVIGIELNESGEIVSYHLRKNDNKKGAYSEVDIVPKAGIVHFTLSDDMGESAPFGESILQCVVKAFKQLGMLEDSVIIYRVVRAPERRVFYIDTGNMPAHKVKQYLEGVKNEVRQKRIPNSQDGQESVDSVYNPTSAAEDYFFATTANGRGSRVETLPGGECLALDTKIKLLDGRDISLSIMIDEYEAGKENWVYSCEPMTGAIVPGKVTWAGITRKNTRVMKLTFDNGESVTVTPDHKFPIKGVGFVEAKDLVIGQSMIPLYLKEEPIRAGNNEVSKNKYLKYYEESSDKWKTVHSMVANYFKGTEYENIWTFKDEIERKTTIHHADFNRYNNNPQNLVWMGNKDHFNYHSSIGFPPMIGTLAAAKKMKWLKANNTDEYDKIINAQTVSRKKWRATLTKEQISEYSNKVSIGVANYINTLDEHQRALRDANSVKNFKIGNEKIVMLLSTDPEFNAVFGQKIKDGQAVLKSSNPEKWAARNEKIGAAMSAYYADQETKIQFGSLIKEKFAAYKSNNPAGFAERNRKLSESRKLEFPDSFVSTVEALVRDSTVSVPEKKEIFNALTSLHIDQCEIFINVNKQKNTNNYKQLSDLNHMMLQQLVVAKCFSGWKDFCKTVSYKNHKIAKIEYLEESIDTGTITVDGFEEFHDYHTFALSCGVFTKNSLGEITDLDYFKEKVFRGLRVPTSYMNSAAKGGQSYNDGKVGVAYVEEMRFANFVKRLQNKIEKVFDAEFKSYLKNSGISVDQNLFKLKLPDPQNFALYRQAALDTDLVNTFSTVEAIPYISKRFALKRYLGYSEDDLQTNEAMLRLERKIPETAEFEDITDLQMFYDPAFYENREAIKYEAPADEAPADEAPADDAGDDIAPGDDAGDDAAPSVDDVDNTKPPKEPSTKSKAES